MIDRVSGNCEYEHCQLKATQIASGRGRNGHKTGCYCDDHAEEVSGEDSPEYVADCPNCGCGFGVN